MANNLSRFDFSTLAAAIGRVDENLVAQADRAVNVSLTLRNWLIGAYIAEYELSGSDRASYGEHLLADLSKELRKRQIASSGRRQLYNYLAFYRAYPQIVRTAPAQFRKIIPNAVNDEKVRTASAQSAIDPEKLVGSLSYSHFELLVALDDDLKRLFYETESIRSAWAVRELKRQIGSLYYERSGLSADKSKLAELAQSGSEQVEPGLAIRDPYVFEFLGLKPKEVMLESDLEDALLDRLQDFLLELGRGVCFEARQKRILIGDTHNFVDLVFYHRILKCHILVELKIEPFNHENIGQLNAYVSWYRENIMEPGDNPPVGLLLCTEKNHALAHYALAGMDNQLFVSRYQLELPRKEALETFIEQQVHEIKGELTLPAPKISGTCSIIRKADKEKKKKPARPQKKKDPGK